MPKGSILGHGLRWTLGYGVHTWNLHNKDIIRPLYVCDILKVRRNPIQFSAEADLLFHQLILIYGCCYSATLPLIKTAILLDWSQIFLPIDTVRSIFWWGCMGIITLQCLWGILCNAQCRPHEAIWKFYLPSK